MIQMTNGGLSNYNALQFTVEHRFAQGLSFVANYTFSKSLDNESVEAQLTVTNPDPFVPRLQLRTFATWTRTHNFSFWTVYNLPGLTSTPGLVRGAFGGWQTTGIWSWRSGLPVNVTSGQDRSLSGVGLDRADLVGNPYLPSGPAAVAVTERRGSTPRPSRWLLRGLSGTARAICCARRVSSIWIGRWRSRSGSPSGSARSFAATSSIC